MSNHFKFVPFLLSALVFGGEAYAQKVEKIEVVGSRIKRIDLEGPQTVEIINRQTIERSGATSVADLLRDNSVAANFGGYRAEVNQGATPAAGATSVNLRGLGEKNTLVLLNGKRMPTNGISGAVDVNIIPMSAVERVEILKDGASAIYGSDAAGGVINIVTRKDFDGWAVDTRYEKPKKKGGDITSASILHGYAGDRWSTFTVLSKRRALPIYERDRDWTSGAASTYAIPGNFRDESSEDWYDYSQAPEKCPGEVIAGQCRYDYSRTSQYYPLIDETTFLNSLEFDLTDSVTMYSRIVATLNQDKNNMAPNAAQFRIPANIADGLDLPNHTAGEDVLVKYRAVGLGNRERESEAIAYDLQVGAKGLLNSGWDWNTSASYGEYSLRSDLLAGHAIVSEINELIEAGTFDPFSADGAAGIRGAAYQPWEENKTSTARIEASVSGELWDMTGGAAALSTGISVGFYTYESTSDALSQQFDEETKEGVVLGNTTSVGEGERQTLAAFAELSLPVTDRLELQTALRFDNYSDFGSAVSPKVAAKWNPIDSFIARANYGTGFRAPSLRQLFQSANDSYPYVVDDKRCAAINKDCDVIQRRAITSGNENLEEETSESYSIGFVFQPDSLLEASIDGWATKIENAIPDEWDFDQLMIADAQGELPAGIEINRLNDDPNGEIQRIIAPLQNVASKNIKGIDYSLKLKFGSPVHGFVVDANYSRVISYKEEALPGLGKIERVGTNEYPNWRMNTNLVYTLDNFEGSLRNLRIARHDKLQSEGQVGSFSKWDAQLRYSHAWNGSVTLGSSNLFNAAPPLDDSQFGSAQLENKLYSAVGRTYYIGLSQNF